jgi:hypothetical protein
MLKILCADDRSVIVIAPKDEIFGTLQSASCLFH